ncbi:3-hydroxybutyryl-CoA dehydrogenase [Polynucleobacter sp. SHI8]|nr:3-hydroxybutyryl-CoA dehydrogenase [Polynucleobacter sp. SHI2]BDW13706.1 3-hydroxybutyryl-CoA dehydrogenase [Polynucleobacter sp. SHI8]
MGAGIAQVAAQSGHTVILFDQKAGATEQAIENIKNIFSSLIKKEKITAEAAHSTLSRIQTISSLDQASHVKLVIEAIIERLDIKRTLFKELESIVTPDCILATNTSSISVTAIANGLQHPNRLVGMHFFNPVPLMKLVEVVSGLQTTSAVASAIYDLSIHWGKTPVHAKSTPGFIVNRIARPFYAEALALIQEQVSSIQVIDACIKSVGFRMGPFELMDLIGHDTNFAVTSSVFEAFFYDRRFTPSIVQKELVDGGLFGRKSGRGFYDYSEDAVAPKLPEFHPSPLNHSPTVTLHGDSHLTAYFANQLKQLGITFTQNIQSSWVGLDVNGNHLRQTDGQTASSLGSHVAVFDLCLQPQEKKMIVAWAIAENAAPEWLQEAPSWLHHLGFKPIRIQDSPALIVARTLAMLINEACDAVTQGVCSMDATNQAMKLGVNYPAGPFDWLEKWNSTQVVQIINQLDLNYKGERYRSSPLLRKLNLL